MLDVCPLVSEWGRPKARIRYKLGKRKRNYHPDILVKYHDGRIFLEEVKGYIFSPRIYIKKKQMAQAYCKKRGWTYRVIFEKDLERIE